MPVITTYPDCACCGGGENCCPCCNNSSYIKQFTLHVEGFADGPGYCHCAQFTAPNYPLPGDFALSWAPIPGYPCRWVEILDNGEVILQANPTIGCDSNPWELYFHDPHCTADFKFVLADGSTDFRCDTQTGDFNFVAAPGQDTTTLCAHWATAVVLTPQAGTGSGPICGAGDRVGCCANYPILPSTLHMTITNLSGCACLDGLSVPLIADLPPSLTPTPYQNTTWRVPGGDFPYTGCNIVGPSNANFIRANLACHNPNPPGSWVFDFGCLDGVIGGAASISLLSANCNPFHFVYKGTFAASGADTRYSPNPCCPSGVIQIDITE